MPDGLKLKPAGIFCSATLPREAYSVDLGNGETFDVKADEGKAIDGCGSELLAAEVRKSRPFGDERPMWRTSSPVLVCPKCDRGES